jgi:hypothetical protein
MTSEENEAPEVFKLEGNARALRELAATIEAALEGAPPEESDFRTSVRSTVGNLAIEVRVTPWASLKRVADTADEVPSLIGGWAEVKRCYLCNEVVALLVDDFYIESAVYDDAVVCLKCVTHADEQGECV